MTTNLAHGNRNSNSNSNSKNRSTGRLIATLVVLLGTTLTRVEPAAASTAFTDVPAVAGFVAGATGYSHPTSWPPQDCIEPTGGEAFVSAQIGVLAPC